MFEFMGLIGLVFLFGLVCVAAFVVILPFYLLMRLLGFALKVGVAGIFVAFLGILLLPVMLVVGAALFLKLALIGIPLLLIGIPLLIAFAIFGWLLGFRRRDEPRPIYVQTVPPPAS